MSISPTKSAVFIWLAPSLLNNFLLRRSHENYNEVGRLRTHSHSRGASPREGQKEASLPVDGEFVPTANQKVTSFSSPTLLFSVLSLLLSHICSPFPRRYPSRIQRRFYPSLPKEKNSSHPSPKEIITIWPQKCRDSHSPPLKEASQSVTKRFLPSLSSKHKKGSSLILFTQEASSPQPNKQHLSSLTLELLRPLWAPLTLSSSLTPPPTPFLREIAAAATKQEKGSPQPQAVGLGLWNSKQ